MTDHSNLPGDDTFRASGERDFEDVHVCMDGPFEVDIKVHITDGANTGRVTIGMANGTMPSAEQIRAAVKEAADAAKEAGMRLMNRHEFITEMMNAGPIAVPGPKDFRT